jgi:DNA mismatch repair protein MutS
MTSLYDEYESYVLKYKQEYGNKTVVLYQCGSFYEVYSCGDDNVNIKEISELLNIQISRRNKAIQEVNRSNTLMCGFPEYTLNKMNILVDNNYTVIVVSQITPPPKPKRAVTQIISPGTRIENNNFETNNLISIYFDNNINIGISIIDISTGVSNVGEIPAKINDPTYSLDELYRIFNIYNPREIILFGNPPETMTYEYIVNYLDIQNKYVHDKINIFPQEYTKLSFQNDFLRKIYNNHGLLSPIEYIDMERMQLATISFIMLLQFAYNHNENILQKIQLPDQLYKDQKLVISSNSIKQLNLNELSVILNTCETACGKRYFKERILNPLMDSSELNKNYDNIDFMLQNNKFINIRKYLSNVYDIQRLFRRIQLKTLHPADCLQIITSCENICLINENNHIINNYCKDIIKAFDILDTNEISKYHLDNISSNFFKVGIFNDIDTLQNELNKYKTFFNDFIIFLNKDNFFKYEYNERDGHYLIITSKRFNEIKNEIYKLVFKWNNEFIIHCKDVSHKNVSNSSNCIKIIHPIFNDIGNIISNLQKQLNIKLLDKFNEIINNISIQFSTYFEIISKYVAENDYNASCAFNAFNFKYTRPTIDTSDHDSYAQIKELRHPIVEKIQNNIQYIANDVEIGIDTTGILLYGINSAGKSTLMKSIGIAIIMAQAGMFVPCNSMKFIPYKQIFTRIVSGDDIMKGQSTFTVEVLEIRNILKRADQYTLVIGDELCCGTESISALSIVTTGIVELSKKKSSFIFATHLHDLTKISYVKNINTLKVFHLSVYYDEKSNKLIYNRKLTEGQGNTLYGLEVCKSIGLSKEFIDIANEVRKELLGIESNLLSSKKSNYNSDKFISVCEICNAKCDEVHHIKEQKLADKNGYIGNFNKNEKFNLLCVCHKCHDDIHNNKYKINGYVQTDNGIQLSYETKEKKNDNNSHQKIIFNLYKNGKKTNDIIKILDSEHKITLSKYKINKMIQNFNL